MTVTLKKLRETIKAFLDKVMDDIKLIAVQEHKDEILYEYKQTLNVSAAITSVTERYKAIEAERARAETEQLERKRRSLTSRLISRNMSRLQLMFLPRWPHRLKKNSLQGQMKNISA